MSRKLHSILPDINRQKAMLLCFCLFLLWNPKKVIAQSFVHPGLPHTISDLNQLKNDITREPWLSAYNAFKNDRRSKLSYVPSTPQPTVSRAPNLNNEPWKSDMVAVHNLAWMWWFTRDTAYARKATDILDAWAVTNTSWGGQEANLDIGDYAQFWGGGAEILRYTYPGWTQANTTHVENYFMNVLFPSSAVPFPLSDQNKGALQLKTAFAASVFCNDRTRFNQTIAVYRMDAGGGMRNSLPNGEVGDTGRDDHWRVQAAALAWGAEVAYKQRVDMFSELDNRVLAIGELYHKYAFDGANMTYIPFGGYASFWTNWGILPGARTGDMTNLIYSAYTVRKGIPTPATDRMRASLGGAGGDFLYLKSTDTATAVKLTPVYYPSEHVSPVTNLTTVDIGNPGIAGSTSFANGNWTVKGAGNSTNNAFSFNFKKVSGDAGLVVKINSISLSTGGFGVMMRESLATGTNFYTLLLNSSGGAGRHYQPKAPWWLKIERVGLRIFTYHSFDGINWTNLGCFYNPNGFPQDLYAGFYSLSNNTSVLNTVNVSNVGFSQNSPQGSPEISSATTASAVLGTPFNYNITATGSPNMFGAANLPAGLSINSATGLISGNPSETGEREVGLTASNTSGAGTATLIFKVFANQVPPAPQSPAANTVNTSQIRISWAAVAGATSYNIKRSSVPGGPYTILQSGILTNSFVDISPVPEDKNYYVISAFIGTKESPNSNEVTSSVPPVIPLTPVAISKTDRISLAWQPVERVNSYKVKRATVSGGPYTTLSTVNTTNFDDLAVTSGKPYYYVVSSVGVSQESGNSGEAFGSPGSSSYVWNPTPASDSLNLSRNWLENMVPVSPAIITFNSSTDTLLTNDISGIATSRIQFGSSANAFSISGNRLTVKNDLINNSLKTQSFLTPLTLADSVNVSPLNGEISLRGQINGSGTLVKSGTSKLSIIGSDNNFTGNTIIKSGILAAAGIGTGIPGSPTTGPLGLGKIIMSGGALQATAGADLNIYNNIEVLPGRSFMYEDINSITLWGKLLGKGTLEHDGNDYAGLNLWGDNTEFEGTFISKLRSGKQRIRFNTPLAGSEKANWLLDANGIDCQGINFANGTIHFGALNGRGYFRVNARGNQVLSIGALNTYSSYGGTINSNGSNLSIVKVGTGVLEMWGNQAYIGNTTVKSGKLLINNNANSGVFPGPIIIEEGALGGFGVTQSSATIGTGSGAGSVLEPGFLKLGTLKVGSLIMNADATYQAEINLSDTTSDQLSANQITLNNPTLSLSITSGSSIGSVYKIIDNTGSNSIIGTFKGLSEGATLEVKGYTFSVTYLGGDGNDVQLKLLSINTAVTSRHAFYKFEESGGTLAVDSWGNNSATLQAGAKRGTGREGSALLLDGAATSYASLPAGIVSNLNDFTISTWVKMDAKATWMRVFDFGTGTSKYMFFSIQVGTANNMRYAIKNGGAEQQLNFTYNLPLNTWVHFTITQSQNVSSVYINGKFVATNPSISIKPSTLGSTNLNYLGKSQFNDPMFRGAIDEFKIYNRALSATEVANTYNSQAITEGASTQKTMGDDDFDPLSSSSGLPVSYVSSNEAIASIVNGKVHLVAPGTVVLTASQAGNENFWPAASISHTLTIKKSQLITFPAIPTKTFGDGEFDPGAKSSSLLDVTYVSSDSTIALVRNGKIRILRSGTVNLTATQAGNQTFGAAKPISQELNIAKQNQAIVFPAIANKTFGDDDFVLAATASSGLAVSYVSSDHSIATIENGKVHLVGVGVVTITASQDGNENISAAASVVQQLNVEKKSQNITFATMEMKNFGMPSFVPNVTSSSNLAVILTSSDESLAKIINGSIHLFGAGQVTITASQPGNQYFSAATPISQIINIGKNSQEINFSSIGTKTFGSADFTLGASASSGLSVTYTSSDPLVARITGNKIQILGAGVATITASQDGNGNYNPALPVSQSLTVIRQSQTISFAPITTKTFGDPDFDPLAASSAALPVSYTSSDESVAVILNGKVHIVGAGTATITADQIGDVNTAPAASASQLLSVSRKAQTISLPVIGVKLLGEDDFNPGAQQSSGLAVTYISSNPSVAEIVNGKIRLLGTGKSTIRAKVEGNKNLMPAESESQEVIVVITKDVNISGKRGQFFSYQISHQASLDRFSASGLPLGLKLNTNTGTISGIPLVAGSFVVKLTASNEISSGSQNITLEIADFSFDILNPLKNIRIYPNPVPGHQFTIATGSDLAGKQVEVKLVDLMGRVVYLATLKNDGGLIKVVLNKSLPSGLYVVILDRKLAGKVIMR